jgi:hypothetical protein
LRKTPGKGCQLLVNIWCYPGQKPHGKDRYFWTYNTQIVAPIKKIKIIMMLLVISSANSLIAALQKRVDDTDQYCTVKFSSRVWALSYICR